MRLIGLVLGVALASALALPVMAQPAPPVAPLTVTPPTPDMMARRMARRAQRVDQDIQTLRAGLQLTAAQAALWPAVADAIHAVDTARGFRFRQAMESAPSQIDGLKLQGDHMAAMGTAIGRLAEATKPLVATLTPDQKSRVPSLLQGVRLPKVVGRALDVPKDTAGSSWGTGQEAPAAGASPAPQSAGGASVAGKPMPSAGASAPSGAAPGENVAPENDEE